MVRKNKNGYNSFIDDSFWQHLAFISFLLLTISVKTETTSTVHYMSTSFECFDLRSLFYSMTVSWSGLCCAHTQRKFTMIYFRWHNILYPRLLRKLRATSWRVVGGRAWSLCWNRGHWRGPDDGFIICALPDDIICFLSLSLSLSNIRNNVTTARISCESYERKILYVRKHHMIYCSVVLN